MILVDGKDWDGVEQNRAATAGLMIIGMIPDGKATKIFKPIAKIAKGAKTWGSSSQKIIIIAVLSRTQPSRFNQNFKTSLSFQL
ncbi:MAG: hypothetical protein CR994_09110 [Maribacter sp.]|nr:MAG: hypothetical protein CR994_09110 [Maribacter sp.]